MLNSQKHRLGTAIGLAIALLSIVAPNSYAAESLSECMVMTTIHHSSAFPDPTYDQLRATALLKAGHAQESIPWFLKALREPNGFWAEQLERECGQAFEKLGNVEQALEHYRKAGLYEAGQLRASLLIRENRFAEAKEAVEQGIRQERSLGLKYKYPTYDRELCKWLRLRAIVEAATNQDQAALADLKEAATWFAQDDSNSLNNCITEYDNLSRKHLGTSLKIPASDLPSNQKQSVLRLLKFFKASTKPIESVEVNNLTGAKFKVPCYEAPICDVQELISPAFWRLEYRLTKKLDPSTALLDITVSTNNCAIDKTTVMKTLPEDKRSRNAIYDFFTDQRLENAEAWELPMGSLVLQFGKSGHQVLRLIRWQGIHINSCGCGDRRAASDYALLERSSLARNDLAQALINASNAIALAHAPANAKDNLARCYVERAHVFDLQNKLAAAIADCESAVRFGGYEYLPKKVEYMVRAGQQKAAIRELDVALLCSKFERERSLLRLLLARICLETNLYSKAILVADECMKSEDSPLYDSKKSLPPYLDLWFTEVERMSAPAHVIKAKAELALGMKSGAKIDAEIAASLFFDIARVSCRDKITNWSKGIASSSRGSVHSNMIITPLCPPRLKCRRSSE